MSAFGRLDENKGTLRILTTLAYNQLPTSRLALKSLLKQISVGGTAFDSSIKTLEELGLVRSFHQVDEGKRYLMTELTEKGYKIAEKLDKIQKILKED